MPPRFSHYSKLQISSLDTLLTKTAEAQLQSLFQDPAQIRNNQNTHIKLCIHAIQRTSINPCQRPRSLSNSTRPLVGTTLPKQSSTLAKNSRKSQMPSQPCPNHNIKFQKIWLAPRPDARLPRKSLAPLPNGKGHASRNQEPKTDRRLTKIESNSLLPEPAGNQQQKSIYGILRLKSHIINIPTHLAERQSLKKKN